MVHYSPLDIDQFDSFSFKKIYVNILESIGFPGASVVKSSPANVGEMSSISGSGRSPGGGKGNPLQYSCLENLMDRGAWWVIVHGVTSELDITLL